MYKGSTYIKTITTINGKKPAFDTASTAAGAYSLYNDPKDISNYQAPTIPFPNLKTDFRYVGVGFC